MRVRRVNTYKAFRKGPGMCKVLDEYLLNKKLKETKKSTRFWEILELRQKKNMALKSTSKALAEAADLHNFGIPPDLAILPMYTNAKEILTLFPHRWSGHWCWWWWWWWGECWLMALTWVLLCTKCFYKWFLYSNTVTHQANYMK